MVAPQQNVTAAPVNQVAVQTSGDRWLLVGNFVTLLMALWQGWSLTDLLFPFWMQSVAIGVLQGRRMLKLKSFSTEGLTVNGTRVAETRSGLRSTVGFFAMHYGGFHFVYLIFIIAFAAQESSSLEAGSGRWFLACMGALIIAEIASHTDDVTRDAAGKPNLGLLMFLPYLRVLPMHAMIFIGGTFGSSPTSVVAFVSLKTVSDWLMQFCERKIEQRSKA